MERHSGGISRRKFLSAVAALVGLAGMNALAACSKPPEPAPAQPTAQPAAPTAVPAKPTAQPVEPTAAPTTGADAAFMRAPEPNPKRGGVLRIVGPYNTTSYDIFQGGNSCMAVTYDNLVTFNIMDGLATIIPQLATRWEMSPDGKEYTFFLRDGVTFHDGTPFSADDVVATFSRAIFPPSGIVSVYKNLYGDVADIQKLDPLTVKFKLNKPYSPFLTVLSTFAGSVYQKKCLDENGQDLKEVVSPGTGPFVYEDHQVGEYWTYKKNENYWNPELPYLDGLKFIYVQQANDRGTALLTGEADWTHNAGNESRLEIEKRTDICQSHLVSGGGGTSLFIHCEKKPFDDPRVRRAVYLTWPRDAMCAVFSQYEPTVLTRWVSYGDPNALPEEEIRKLPGYREDKEADVAEAKRLLAEAGYGDGIKGVEMLAVQDHISYHLAVAIQDWMKRQLNIEINLKTMQLNLLTEEEQKGNFTLLVHWPGVPGGLTDFGLYASRFYQTGGPGNYGKYSNPELDPVIDDILVESDETKRDALIRKAEDMLDANPPTVRNGVNLMGQSWRNEVKGGYFENRIRSSTWDFDTVWLDL